MRDAKTFLRHFNQNNCKWSKNNSKLMKQCERNLTDIIIDWPRARSRPQTTRSKPQRTRSRPQSHEQFPATFPLRTTSAETSNGIWPNNSGGRKRGRRFDFNDAGRKRSGVFWFLFPSTALDTLPICNRPTFLAASRRTGGPASCDRSTASGRPAKTTNRHCQVFHGKRNGWWVISLFNISD